MEWKRFRGPGSKNKKEFVCQWKVLLSLLSSGFISLYDPECFCHFFIWHSALRAHVPDAAPDKQWTLFISGILNGIAVLELMQTHTSWCSVRSKKCEQKTNRGYIKSLISVNTDGRWGTGRGTGQGTGWGVG